MLLLAVSVMLVTDGCKSINNLTEGISEKSISGSGTVVLNRVGLDKTDKTPELFSLFVWGDYTSVVPGDEVMRYEAVDDASIFNSNAKTTKIKMFYSSGDKARMDKFITAVKADAEKRLNNDTKKSAISDTSTPAATTVTTKDAAQ